MVSKRGGQAPGQKNAAALNADQRHLGAVFVALGDFVRDAGQGAPHGRRVEDYCGDGIKKSNPPKGLGPIRRSMFDVHCLGDLTGSL
jgi:hypothetical protein